MAMFTYKLCHNIKIVLYNWSSKRDMFKLLQNRAVNNIANKKSSKVVEKLKSKFIYFLCSI